MKSNTKKYLNILLIYYILIIFTQNTVTASNNIPDKVLSSTIFLFKKNINNSELPIGTGVAVENGNILINYSSFAPYESLIPNSNNRYSILDYTEIDSIVLRNYSNNQYYVTTINKIVAFDKELNLLLLEPKIKIGKAVEFSKSNSKNNSLTSYTIPYFIHKDQLDLHHITKYELNSNKNETTTFFNKYIDTANIVNIDSSRVITIFQTPFFNKNSELIISGNSYNGKIIDYMKHEEFLQLGKQYYENYKILLAIKNGNQFKQFYIAEQFNAVRCGTAKILYIDSICKRLKKELYSVKKINYFNSIEEYDKLNTDLDIFISTFESSTLYEVYANDLHELGLRDDALQYINLSRLKENKYNIYSSNSPYKLIKYCKWLLEDNQIAQALTVLQNSYNYYDDWRVLSEIDILISYCELLSGNLKEAEIYKNISIKHGILFYNNYGQDIIDAYRYISEKLDNK